MPELGAEVVSTNVVIYELATGELEQGEIYKKLSKIEIAHGNQKVYTVEEFEYLKGTVHTDNEDGLQYRIINIRVHSTRRGAEIVVDRVCLVGGHTDTVYARDAAAMTGPIVEPGDQSAAASLGLAATSERTLVESTSARDR